MLQVQMGGSGLTLCCVARSLLADESSIQPNESRQGLFDAPCFAERAASMAWQMLICCNGLTICCAACTAYSPTSPQYSPTSPGRAFLMRPALLRELLPWL